MVTPEAARAQESHSDDILQRLTHVVSSHAQTHSLTLTQSQAKTLQISSQFLHSAEKRLKCHKRSCSHRGQWQHSEPLLPASLLPAPYHSHSMHISLTLLTLSFLFPRSSPSFSLVSFSSLALWSVSSPCPASAHNAHQLFRGSLPVSPAYPIRVWLCTNGLPLYLLPAPTHSRGAGGRGGVMKRNRQKEQWRQPRRRKDERKR